MNKISTKLLSLLLVITMLIPSASMIAQAVSPKTADGTVTFDLDDIIEGQEGKVDVSADDDGNMNMNFRDMPKESPIKYNESDSKYDAGDNLSYVGTMKDTGMGLYKVKDSSNVHFVDSETEIHSDAENYLNACLNQKPMTNNDIRKFVNAGNRSFVSASGSSIEKNHTSKIRIVNEGNAASDNILVLDDDAFSVIVKDLDGKIIKGAYVTIKYTDLKGNEQTRTTITDDLCGAATFDQMKGICFAAIDIQHPDYRSKTSLNVEIEAGEAVTKYVEPKQENELYIRCADLDGLDMMEFVGDISVSDDNLFKQGLTYTIMVSKNGDKTLPETINICAENAGQKRVVKTLTKSTDIKIDDDTALYMCNANWVSDEFFRNGDIICYDIEPNLLKASSASGSGSDTKTSVTVSDAKTKTPVWTNVSYGFLNGIASYTFEDSIPVLGGSNVGFDAFKCPLSFAILPDGSVFMSYGLNLVNKSKPEDIVSASWNPSKSEQAKSFFDKANDEFLDKIAQFREGKDIIANRSAETWTAVDYSSKFRVDIIFSALGKFDKETNKVSVKLGAAICVSGSFGMTWYVMIPIGPVTLPAYAGFNAGIDGKAAGYITLSMDIKEKSIGEMLSSINIEAAKDDETGISIDVILSLAAYVGVGLHGLADVQVTGSVYADFGLDISSGMTEHKKSAPRFRISGGYRVDLSATFMWFNFNKKLAGDSKMFYDSWGLYDSASPLKLSGDKDTTVKKVDLNASQSTITKLAANDISSDVEQYKLSKPLMASNGDSESELIDGKTLNGGSPRYILVGKYAVLFRMMPVNGRVRLVYQLMQFDGTLSDVVNVLPLPDRNSSQKNNDVVQFDVFAYNNVLHIAVIACSADEDDVEKRAKTTYAVAEAFGFNDTSRLYKRVVDANPNGDYLSNPVAIYSSKGSNFYRCGYTSTDLETEKTTWHYSDNKRDSDVQNIFVQEYRYASDWTEYNRITNPIGFKFSSADGDDIVYKPVCADTYSEENSGALQFNYKDITGTSWDGKTPIISAYKSITERVFVVIGGKLCYIKYRHPDINSVAYTIEKVKDKYGNDITLADSDVYDFQWGLDGTLCLTAVACNYDSDGDYQNSTLYVYRITEPYGTPVIHGPSEFTMHISEPSNFTAVVDSPTGACTAFYTKPSKKTETAEGITDSAQLYQWTQAGFAQVKVQSVAFTKGYVSAKDETLPITVVCKNNGTNRVDSVKLSIYLDKVDKYIEKSYPVDIYPGDTEIVDMTDTPRPSSWTKAQSHSIGVRSDIDGGPSRSLLKSSEEDDMYTVTFDTSYLKMDVKTKFTGGRNRAFVTISNESMIASKSPVIQLVGKFKKKSADDTDNERVIKNIDLPIRQLTDADVYENGDIQGIKYNTSFDLDEIWDQYADGKDVLYSLTVRLVPKAVASGTVTGEEAAELCNNMPETAYIANPNISKVVKVDATSNVQIMGRVEGDGIYNFGDTVNLKAVPNAGHKFAGWFDGEKLISEDAELTFNATENVNYEAKFVMDLKSVKLDNVTVKKGETIKLNPVIDALDGTKYTVEYTSSNEKLAVVDNDGNVKALRAGNVVITCKATDQYGNKVQDSCIVTVKQHWLLRLLDFIFIDIIHIDKIFKKK